jgi:hypothetical protein
MAIQMQIDGYGIYFASQTVTPGFGILDFCLVNFNSRAKRASFAEM